MRSGGLCPSFSKERESWGVCFGDYGLTVIGGLERPRRKARGLIWLMDSTQEAVIYFLSSTIVFFFSITVSLLFSGLQEIVLNAHSGICYTFRN